MPTITINDRKVEFEGRKLIIDIARENGIEIPHYCYHPGLSVVASCRICLAQVAQPNPRNEGRVEMIPKLVPTCQTMAVDGMEVYTQTPAAIANQKAVMEYLLINHPLDCPVCDQAGECHLQDYSYKYGRAASRFEEDKIKQPKKDIGPNVYLYADRCIMCSRCVRFTREVSGTGEIGVVGRGNQEQIDVFPGKPLDNELSANVVDICPVGALLDKEFLFQQRVWFLSRAASIDGITASGDNIWIEHNEGEIYRVKPRENPDVNQWWITDEVRYGWKFVHREDRLTQPTRLQFGLAEPCTWAKAYEEARQGFNAIASEHGPGTLAALISPMLTCEEAYLLGTLIRGLDPNAILAVGPIPTDGQDKSFPGGFTAYAEKCPNSRGVRRALDLVAGGDAVLDFDAFLTKLADKASPVQGVLITGNYTDAWPTKDLTAAVKKKYTVVIDTLPNDLTKTADIFLPSATWAEKTGTFENAKGRLQAFDRALTPLEGSKPEGQTALEILDVCGLTDPSDTTAFDPAEVRAKMGGPFTDQVHQPDRSHEREPDMQYVQL